ncbi:MAG: glycosyltransferase family 2 protein [Fibrobacter sp.]|nr:glycosyltransferase family 2 protein [Fibrobacter sp.]
MNTYVLITPAKNEENNIEKTILSVVAQTHRPLEWMIVSDSSTDKTDEIIKSYSQKYDFIKYMRNESNVGKDFSSKVNAFNTGLAALTVKQYDYIGNLDADVSFGENYYKEIINKFNQDYKLGLAGGFIKEFRNGKIITTKKSMNSVSGAVQLFRRKCFEDIGGYIPLKIGGIDTAAEISARAKGWVVKTFSEYTVLHYGPVLTGSKNRYRMFFKMGISNYQLGYHPAFQTASSLGKVFRKPYLVGAICYFSGFLYARLQKMEKKIPEDIIAYLRKEQLGRLFKSNRI